MDAKLLSTRLDEAAKAGRNFTLLLRGAHRLNVASATVQASFSDDGEARLDIDGLIGADGDEPAPGTVSVSSADVASIFVRHDHQQRTAP